MRGNVFVKLANTGEIRSEYENELRKVSGYMLLENFSTAILWLLMSYKLS
mgnify:CR=1 FL=1